MTAPTIFIAAKPREGNHIPVEWRIGTIKPKGIINVELPDAAPGGFEAAIAEMTAIRFLVDNKKIGTSMRPHEVVVSQRAIKDLLNQEANETPLVPYGRFLYLYVDTAKVSVAKGAWAEGLEVDQTRIWEAKAVESAWPEVFCQAMGASIGVTRHAVDRYIERRNVRKDHWHAFQTLTKALQSPYLRVVPTKEIEKTNPGMRLNERTTVLHQVNTDTAFIVVREANGEFVLVTVHHYHQEYIPTFVGGRVEYRRNL